MIAKPDYENFEKGGKNSGEESWLAGMEKDSRYNLLKIVKEVLSIDSFSNEYEQNWQIFFFLGIINDNDNGFQNHNN